MLAHVWNDVYEVIHYSIVCICRRQETPACPSTGNWLNNYDKFTQWCISSYTKAHIGIVPAIQKKKKMYRYGTFSIIYYEMKIARCIILKGVLSFCKKREKIRNENVYSSSENIHKKLIWDFPNRVDKEKDRSKTQRDTFDIFLIFKQNKCIIYPKNSIKFRSNLPTRSWTHAFLNSSLPWHPSRTISYSTSFMLPQLVACHTSIPLLTVSWVSVFPGSWSFRGRMIHLFITSSSHNVRT